MAKENYLCHEYYAIFVLRGYFYHRVINKTLMKSEPTMNLMQKQNQKLILENIEHKS